MMTMGGDLAFEMVSAFGSNANASKTPTGAHAARYALVIDDLLKVPHGHGRAPQVVHLALLLLRALGVGLDPLLVPHELLLHEQPVLDALELELAQKTLGLLYTSDAADE